MFWVIAYVRQGTKIEDGAERIRIARFAIAFDRATPLLIEYESDESGYVELDRIVAKQLPEEMTDRLVIQFFVEVEKIKINVDYFLLIGRSWILLRFLQVLQRRRVLALLHRHHLSPEY